MDNSTQIISKMCDNDVALARSDKGSGNTSKYSMFLEE
jgi:hypothetical protein